MVTTDRPDVHPGDTVWCRTAAGTWWQTTARSEPRFDHGKAIGRGHLTVAVGPYPGRGDGDDVYSVNWPAEDVRTTPPEEQEE